MYIIAGCNGAGKTTASYTILPEILHCKEFVNADNIAAGLSPFNAEAAAFKAGRIMLERINELMNEGADFAFETTLSTKSYVSLIKAAKGKGYTITLLFLWLHSAEIAKERVAKRVKNGGHNIAPDVIERRYKRGLFNLIHLYISLCDEWLIINGLNTIPDMIAKGKTNTSLIIINHAFWNVILNQSNYNERDK